MTRSELKEGSPFGPDTRPSVIAGIDPSNNSIALRLAADGTIATSAPVGGATSAKQDSQTTLLTAIDGHVDGLEASATSIDGKITACNTGAVTVSTLPGVEGKVAHDASGTAIKPLMAGALARDTYQTAVSDDDLTRLSATKQGNLHIHPFGAYGNFFTADLGYNNTSSVRTLKAAPGAGKRLLITDITLSQFDATTAYYTASSVSLGTIDRWVFKIEEEHVHTYPGGMLLGDNEALSVQLGGGTLTNGYSATARGYVVPS
jgi:hypothetical protein